MFFWEDLERFSDNVAILTESGESITYQELAQQADEAGFAGGRRRLALIEADNSLPAVVAYLGALRAGHAVLLLATGKPEDTARLTELYRPELIWTQSSGLRELSETPVGELHSELKILLSTSGSTGSSKLVRLSVTNIDANARSIASYLGLEERDRAITTLPLAYSYGLSVLHSRLAGGCSIALTNRSVTDPGFRELMARCQPTTIAGVPYTYELLLASGGIDDLPDSVRLMTQAGGKLVPELVEKVHRSAEQQNAQFFVMYGATEATARMAFVPPDKLSEYPDCIGGPIPGGSFRLVDPETGDPADDVGELAYRGPNVMMGYAETREDLARGDEVEELATGDLAEEVAPDIYRVTARKSRFLKLFGLRISLAKVEQEAGRMGWTAIATGDDRRLVVAYEGSGEARTLARTLAQRFNLPAGRVIALAFEKIPRLTNGKPDYQAILASIEDEGAKGDAGPVFAKGAVSARQESNGPQIRSAGERSALDDNPCLQKVTAAFSELFERDDIDPDESFMSLGGDSLSYVQAYMILEEIVGTVPDEWHAMSLREISRHGRPVSRHTARIESIIFLRALFITLVVAIHAPLTSIGDSATSALLVISGYLFCKSNWDSMFASGRPANMLRSITHLLPLTALFTWATVVWGLFLDHPIPWANVMLMTDLVNHPSFPGMIRDEGIYWYLHSLIKVIAIVFLLQVLVVRRIRARSNQYLCLIAICALGFAVRLTAPLLFFDQPQDLPSYGLTIYQTAPFATLPLFYLGMCLALPMKKAQYTLILAGVFIVCLLSLYSFGMAASLYLALIALVLLFVPVIKVPRFSVGIISAVASASFYIYLVHTWTNKPWRLLHQGQLSEGDIYTWGMTIVGLVAGVAFMHLVRHSPMRWLARG